MPTEFEPLAAGQYTYTLYEHYDENGYLLEVGSSPLEFQVNFGEYVFSRQWVPAGHKTPYLTVWH